MKNETQWAFAPPNLKTMLAAMLLAFLALMPMQAFAGLSYHTVTLQNDGTLLAWGYNIYGQLGDGTTTNRSNPVVVTDALGNTITGIQSVSAGVFHTVALKTDGTLLAWGRNNKGQLGDGTLVNRSNPIVVTDALGNTITGIQSVSAGGDSTVALKTDGTLLAWGYNIYGQLGDGTTTKKINPVVVTDALGNTITGIQSVSAGYRHTVALKTDRTLLAWGYNLYGRLGDGTTTTKHNPVMVTDALGNTITGIQSVDAGRWHTVALKTDGTLLAWGRNTSGQLGDGTTTKKINPVVVTDALGNTITGIQSITAGGFHTVALKTDGTLLAWGENTAGSLGDGTTTKKINPVVVTDSLTNRITTGIQTMTTGFSHTVALKTDGTLLAWGYNVYGQLGDGTVTNKSNPVVVTDALGNAISNVASLMNVVASSGDTTPPVVTAPIDIYVSAVDINGTPASNSLITTFLAQVSAIDNIDGSLTPTNNALTIFPIGITTVTFTATDAAGNIGTATATVTVQSLATPVISNIANGATLAGTSQTFNWVDTGASSYRLLVGARFGGSGYFDSLGLAAGTTSVTATGLPEKGVPIYVRLYAWTGGVWLKKDQTYVGAAKTIATVTSPANGVTLAATSQTFSWTDTGADKYFLKVGNFSVGGSDLYSSGLLAAGTTSVTVSGLPNDGSTIHARLYTWGNGGWQTSDTSYVAMPNTGTVAAPANGATLASPNQTFTWVDTGAPFYYFIVGTALGRADIHQSGNLAAGTTSAAVSGLPTGGVPIYVRLYSWGNGSWNISNSTYTSAP